MGTFIHNGNKIIINGESFDYEIFSLLEPEYTLSGDEVARVYEQGKKHFTTTGKRQIPQLLNWIDGDRYIARVNDLKMIVWEKEQTEKIEKERILKLKRKSNSEKENSQKTG